MTALTWFEFVEAAHVGLLRFAASRLAELDIHESLPMDTGWLDLLAMDANGAAGERLVAKARAEYWTGAVGTFHRELDTTRYDVRATPLRTGCLILRPSDPEDRPYVLVVDQPPRSRVVGFFPAHGARLDAWWRTPNGRPGAHFIPQSALRPLP